ncbi:MAG: bifunctional UDP-sugar hydrolase/5'-nucleotidase [Bacteroidales bacterium]
MIFTYRNSSLTIVTISLICLFSSCGAGRPSGEYNIEIYSQNDVHGRFFDSLYVEKAEHKSSIANISQFINERRIAIGEENVLTIDNGDNLQGDNATYYFNIVEQETNSAKHLFSRIMNYLKFDAVVVGNHDIEAGHPVYDRVKKELNMPYLAANAIKTNGVGSYFSPYTLIDKNGVKTAIIGMTNPNIKKWLAPSLWEGINFVPISYIADSIVNAVIKKEKPHIVVLAIHSGLGDGIKDNYENQARYLAASLKNVDIIFAAHDHLKACEKVWNGVDSVLLLTGGSKAEMLSQANINLVLKNGNVISKNIHGRLISMANTPKDTAYINHFKGDFNKVKIFTNRKIGSLSNNIITSDAYFGSSNYMDIIHYVQLTETGADISFSAPLAMNAVIKEGDINYQDLFTLYPYENQLYVINLKGKQIKGYLEFAYNTWINTMNSKDDHIMNIIYDDKTEKYRFKNMSFNFDSGAGINYEVDVTKPYGERINILSRFGGKVFYADSTYKVAISSYRANGGGDIMEKGAGIASNKLNDIIVGHYPEVRDLIYKYFLNDSLKSLPKYSNWKFVPESYTKQALKKDRALIFM